MVFGGVYHSDGCHLRKNNIMAREKLGREGCTFGFVIEL